MAIECPIPLSAISQASGSSTAIRKTSNEAKMRTRIDLGVRVRVREDGAHLYSRSIRDANEDDDIAQIRPPSTSTDSPALKTCEKTSTSRH
jgi:hypothetical protein